jgi:uncharacterized protein (DUF58 family)
MASAEQYLKPEVIRQVSRLDLRAKFIVEGFLAGLHDSPYHGFSVEFSEHRRYVPGDDLRLVDWTVYGKTDKFYIKKYEAETNLQAHLVVDMSESMAYSYSGAITKLDYAICLAASLAYMMINQQDAVGLVTFDESMRAYIPARSRRSQLTAILGELTRRAPKGRTALAPTLHEAAQLIRRRGLVIVFSDLLTDPEPVYDALHHLRFRGQDVVLFHVLDEAEATFPFEGPVRFEEVETGERLVVDPLSIRAGYLAELAAFIEGYRTACYRANIDYVQVDTSLTFDKALMSFLVARKSRF